MRVFLSWSGPTSRRVAEALRDWLPDVIQDIEPWMSSSDIEAGARWAAEIGKTLEQADFGVVCLAPDNTSAPWILFEAGALSKRFDSSRVLPYLFRLSPTQVSGPLSQFQNVLSDREGTRRMVGAIYAALQDSTLTPERLERAFERWWPTLETALAGIPEPAPATVPPMRAEKDLLEEVLALVRDIRFSSVGARESASEPRWPFPRLVELLGNGRVTTLVGEYIKENPGVTEVTELDLKKFYAMTQNAERNRARRVVGPVHRDGDLSNGAPAA
jgi:TIR domain